MLRASSTNFTPDSALQFRAPTVGATGAAFTSAAIPLSKLAAYWHTNEWGVAKRLLVVVGLPAVTVSNEQSYEFKLEVDDAIAFSSPVVVARAVFTGVTVATSGGQLLLSVDVADMANFDVNAAFVRLVMTPTAGRDTATVSIANFLAANDEFTLNDGTNGVKSVKVGTPETATVAFSFVADVGDTITINDGVNAPVVFTFAAAASGNTTVAVGASATASAQNLKTHIELVVAAGLLDVSVAGAGATLTITNLAGVSAAVFAVSTITKVDVDNDYTITDFAGGIAGAVQPQNVIVQNGGVFNTQLDQVVAAVNAITPASFTATRVAGLITIKNSLPNLGTSSGTALEVTDAGAVMVVTNFSVAAPSINFWAYVKSGANPH